MNTFTLDGLTFRVEHEYDADAGEPWKNCDGHGPVSEWRAARDKRAGERALYQERGGSVRYYNWQEAMKLAKRDGWGLSDKDRAELAAKLKREPTAGEIREAAVQRDFDFLRGWGNGEWGYISVLVTLLDVDGGPTSERESLCGIESCAGDYLVDVARELAGEIAARVGAVSTYTVTVPARTTIYKIRE